MERDILLYQWVAEESASSEESHSPMRPTKKG